VKNLYQKRIVDKDIAEFMQYAPAILIEGAKAVGKTETASN
jgi:hypothetical protein